jgi:hypothetical protein
VKANELECTLYHETGEVYLTYAYQLPDHIEYLKRYVGTETWSAPTSARKTCSYFLEHYELEKDLVEIDYHCDVAHPVEYKVFGLNIIDKVTKHKKTLLPPQKLIEPFYVKIGFTQRCDQR